MLFNHNDLFYIFVGGITLKFKLFLLMLYCLYMCVHPDVSIVTVILQMVVVFLLSFRFCGSSFRGMLKESCGRSLSTRRQLSLQVGVMTRRFDCGIENNMLC